MNLNTNARLETIEVSNDPALADFIDGVFGERFSNQAPGQMSGGLPPARDVAALLDPNGAEAQALADLLDRGEGLFGAPLAGSRAS